MVWCVFVLCLSCLDYLLYGWKANLVNKLWEADKLVTNFHYSPWFSLEFTGCWKEYWFEFECLFDYFCFLLFSSSPIDNYILSDLLFLTIFSWIKSEHLVIFQTGEICLDILKNAWSPAWTLQSVCRAIIALMAHPEPDSPLNCDSGWQTLHDSYSFPYFSLVSWHEEKIYNSSTQSELCY